MVLPPDLHPKKDIIFGRKTVVVGTTPFVTLRRSVIKLLGKHDILGWWWKSCGEVFRIGWWKWQSKDYNTWYILSKVTVKCDFEIMQNRSKGSLCPILQIHKWYLIIFYDTQKHIRFSAVKFSKFQTSPTPNKQPQLQTSDRFVPDPAHVPNNPKAAMIRKYPRKLPASGRRNDWQNSTWEDSTLAIFFQRKRMTKHCANPCQPRMSEEHFHEPFKVAHLLQLVDWRESVISTPQPKSSDKWLPRQNLWKFKLQHLG